MTSGPRVSVGMPTFNKETTVVRAVESVTGQTLADFELIVSDNASTDATEVLCRRLAAADARIRYTRQPAPITPFENYRFVLDAARAPYFMWLPADDYALPRLLERSVAVLDARPDVVCCAPGVEFLETDGRRWRSSGTFALTGTLRENIERFLDDPRDNSRFYGLYRRDVVRVALPPGPYYAFDWMLSVASLAYGKHWELDEVLLVREASDPVRYMRLVDEMSRGRAASLLPLATFTRAILSGRRRVPLSARALFRLLRLNLMFHIMYARHRYPRYGRLAERVGLRLRHLGTDASLRRG
ncbi:MAG TPA: glycosyltransferase family 2 protein [Methylomirabilota bacterium]|nr:glycosyltransferase family 2 protein [Methylomirabilota bacterium]